MEFKLCVVALCLSVLSAPVLPATTKSCGGWFSGPCETTTTTTTTTPPPPPPAKSSCGGWFSRCDDSTTTTSTPPPSPVPLSSEKSCGGWFGPKCPTALSLPLVTTTNPPVTTAQVNCGGWFSPACETTVAPQVQLKQDTSCSGWFFSSCQPEPSTTTEPPKPKGLFGGLTLFSSAPQATEASTQAPSKGWISGLATGFVSKVGDTVGKVKDTAGKAVSTTLDVVSKITTATLNGGIDFFLGEIKLVVKTINKDIVPLPDLDIPLYPGASLKATGGYFKSLLSISRGGDIVVSRQGMSMIIDFPVQLKDMEIGFKDYTITVLMGMGTSGNIKVGVKENKINIRVRMTVSTSCALNLEKVDFAVLDGLDIQMTYGCSYCGYITDQASTYLANFLKNTIRLQIQGQIDSILKKTLSENSLICSKFMGA